MPAGLLTDYITKNYKRLLICVVPPRNFSTTYVSDDDNSQQDENDQLPSLDDLHRQGFAPSRSTRSSDANSRWRRRRSSPSLNRSRSTRDPNHQHRRQRDGIYMHDGEQLVRVDPFRGCVSSRSTGPRTSGDFVVMGCMQV